MFRGILIVIGVALVLLLVTVGLTVRGKPPASSGWKAFSISPATGRNTTINPDRVVSEGTSLKTLISVAYSMPQVRIFGPEWLAEACYAITAIVSPDASDSLQSLLQEELANRLNLKVHIEPRPFDVFILRARKGAESGQVRAGRDSGTWIGDHGVRAREVTVGSIANLLQSILGKPVIDETHIAGHYTFEVAWGEDRAASVKAVLENRFGLHLDADRRQLDALIVDSAELSGALSLVRRTARVTDSWPAGLRRTVSRALGGR